MSRKKIPLKVEYRVAVEGQEEQAGRIASGLKHAQKDKDNRQ